MVCLDGFSIVHFYRIVNIWYYFRHFSQSGAVKNSKMLCLHRGQMAESRSCFYCLFKLRFQRLVDGADGGGIGFDGRAVIGEQAVHLVLHVVSWVYTSADRPFFSCGSTVLRCKSQVALGPALPGFLAVRSLGSSGALMAGAWAMQCRRTR